MHSGRFFGAHFLFKHSTSRYPPTITSLGFSFHLYPFWHLYLVTSGPQLRSLPSPGGAGGGCSGHGSSKLRYHLITLISLLTYTSFNIHFITPGSIFLTVDDLLILSIAWVAPVFSWTNILDSCCIRSWPTTCRDSPVIGTQVILPHTKWGYGAVNCQRV